MKIVSACLLGIKCRYNGADALNEKVLDLGKKDILISLCPEILGGLKRQSYEIVDGSGEDVLDRKARVVTKLGEDVTEKFIKGAEEVLKLAKLLDVKEAILKQRSPSCGCGKIYDGTFSGRIIKGSGVTTALLKRNGIKVTSEEDFR